MIQAFLATVSHFSQDYFAEYPTLQHLIFPVLISLAALLNLIVHVPEVITGLVGLCFVLAAYYSSRRERQGVISG